MKQAKAKQAIGVWVETDLFFFGILFLVMSNSLQNLCMCTMFLNVLVFSKKCLLAFSFENPSGIKFIHCHKVLWLITFAIISLR